MTHKKYLSSVPDVGNFLDLNTTFFNCRVPNVGDVEKKCTWVISKVHISG